MYLSFLCAEYIDPLGILENYVVTMFLSVTMETGLIDLHILCV